MVLFEQKTWSNNICTVCTHFQYQTVVEPNPMLIVLYKGKINTI